MISSFLLSFIAPSLPLPPPSFLPTSFLLFLSLSPFSDIYWASVRKLGTDEENKSFPLGSSQCLKSPLGFLLIICKIQLHLLNYFA